MMVVMNKYKYWFRTVGQAVLVVVLLAFVLSSSLISREGFLFTLPNIIFNLLLLLWFGFLYLFFPLLLGCVVSDFSNVRKVFVKRLSTRDVFDFPMLFFVPFGLLFFWVFVQLKAAHAPVTWGIILSRALTPTNIFGSIVFLLWSPVFINWFHFFFIQPADESETKS